MIGSRRKVSSLATGLALALALTGCTASPSTLVVSGTVEDRLETVAVPAVSVPAVNLDAGFTTLTGATNPVTGRTSANLSTVGTTYGFGTFVRLAEVTVAVGDTVTAGQPSDASTPASWSPRSPRPRRTPAVAAAQVDLLGDAIDTTYDKQADINDAKAKVRDAIDKIHDGKRKLAQGPRHHPEEPAGLAKQGLAADRAGDRAASPGCARARRSRLQQISAGATAAIRTMNAGV